MNLLSFFANNSPPLSRGFSDSPQGLTPNKPDSFWQKVFAPRWVRILIVFLAFLIFLLLWSQVSYQFTAVVFTILPLFIGYGLSYLLQPVNNFFQQFVSKRTSQILVFIFFLIVALGLIFGLFFLFFVQLDGLYRRFFYQTGNLKTFLQDLKQSQGVDNLQLSRFGSDKFKLKYSLLINNALKTEETIFNKKTVAGVFVLLLQISTSFPLLQGICLSLVGWLNENITDYAYLRILWNNWQGIVLILYLLFFTIIIGAFSLGKGEGFFDKLWKFFVSDYEPAVAQQLKVDLKRNLSAWARGLLIVELYIMVGTGISLFTAGIIFSSWSSYLEAGIVLTLFMTLCNLIPYIGPTIGFIPIITIGLIDVVNHGADLFVSWLPFIIAFLACWLVQIGESAVVSPLVYSYQVKLSPILIIVALALTGVIFGFFWMPLAIPAMLVGRIFYQTLYQKKDDKLNPSKT